MQLAIEQDFMKYLSPALHASGGRQQEKVEWR